MNMDHFKQMHDWKKQWNHFFGEDFWKGFEPMLENTTVPVNIYKAENELLVVISAPGLQNVKDVDITVQYQTIEVKGNINLNYKGYEILEESIFQGKIERVIQLPFPVREDRIDASYHSGLLIINLHKRIPDEHRKKVTIKKID